VYITTINYLFNIHPLCSISDGNLIALFFGKTLVWFNLHSTKNVHFSFKDEVLQSHTVFLNVSKGQVAKKEDLTKAFGSATETEICKEILAKGNLQVSDKERHAQQDSLFKEVATHISEMCVNPESRRPHPVSMIEKAMKECHIAIKPNKNAKQQALETIGKIKGQIPLARAQMRLRLSFPLDVSKRVLSTLKQVPSLVSEKEERGEDGTVIICLIDPGVNVIKLFCCQRLCSLHMHAGFYFAKLFQPGLKVSVEDRNVPSKYAEYSAPFL
jgi:rRNA metabolism SBDS family protein